MSCVFYIIYLLSVLLLVDLPVKRQVKVWIILIKFHSSEIFQSSRAPISRKRKNFCKKLHLSLSYYSCIFLKKILLSAFHHAYTKLASNILGLTVTLYLCNLFFRKKAQGVLEFSGSCCVDLLGLQTIISDGFGFLIINIFLLVSFSSRKISIYMFHLEEKSRQIVYLTTITALWGHSH